MTRCFSGFAGTQVTVMVRDFDCLEGASPPEAVIPHLAWRGRVTLLASREKVGKSTLLSALVARITRNEEPWDKPCE